MPPPDRAFVHELLERYGSPLYLYDLDELRARARALRALLPEGAALYYSLKTNPLAGVAAELREGGCRVELSSTAELAIALAAGFAPEEILYSGPGKTPRSNAEALAMGVRAFTCDSWTDMERLAASARAARTTARSLLRIHVADEPAYQVGVGARQSHFGVDARTIVAEARRRRAALDGVELDGIHVYAGTQIPGTDALCRTFAATIELGERLAGEGFAPRVLDLGGGFPWPFAVLDEAQDMDGLRPRLAALAAAREQTGDAELWFESGRYLAASAGTLVATVLDVKTVPGGQRVVVLDTGTMHLGGLSGLGLIHRAMAHVEPVGEPRGAPEGGVEVVGPTDSPLDRVARGASLPPLEPGDVVRIPNVGAYGLTASLVAFAGREMPCEVCYRGARVVAVHRLRLGHERVVPENPAQ